MLLNIRYLVLQAVEAGVRLGPKLESTLPVWRLASDKYEGDLAIKMSRFLGFYLLQNRTKLYAGVQWDHISLPQLICAGIFRTLTLAGIMRSC